MKLDKGLETAGREQSAVIDTVVGKSTLKSVGKLAKQLIGERALQIRRDRRDKGTETRTT
jgi:hypothetical protein